MINWSKLTFKDKRKAFLDWRFLKLPVEVEPYLSKSPYLYGRNKELYNAITSLQLCILTIKGEEINQSEIETYDPYYFNPEWNTRLVGAVDFILEFDTDFITSSIAMSKVVEQLQKLNQHFSLWYADGMRSHHLRIYDLLPPDLDPEVAKQTRKHLAQQITDWADWQYIDYALFENDHTVCLEFSKHWRYGTMLKLVHEFVPERNHLTDQEIYSFSKEGICL